MEKFEATPRISSFFVSSDPLRDTGNFTESEKKFNLLYTNSLARSAIKRAFGMLKGDSDASSLWTWVPWNDYGMCTPTQLYYCLYNKDMEVLWLNNKQIANLHCKTGVEKCLAFACSLGLFKYEKCTKLTHLKFMLSWNTSIT